MQVFLHQLRPLQLQPDRAPNLGLVERFNFGLLPRFNLSLVARFNFGLPTNLKLPLIYHS